MTDSTYDALHAALLEAERSGLRAALSAEPPVRVRVRVSSPDGEAVEISVGPGVSARGDAALRDRLFGWMRSAQAGIDAGTDPAPVRAIVHAPASRIDWDAAGRLPLETLRFARLCEACHGGRDRVLERLDNLIAWRRTPR